MMITIAVLGIIATTAVPAFRSMIESNRSRNAGLALLDTLNLARSEAAKRNQSVTITKDPGGWHDGWTVLANDGTPIADVAELPGIWVSGGTAPLVNSVTYLRSGRVQGGVQPLFEIDIRTPDTEAGTAAEHVRCLSVALTGMPRLDKGECP